MLKFSVLASHVRLTRCITAQGAILVTFSCQIFYRGVDAEEVLCVIRKRSSLEDPRLYNTHGCSPKNNNEKCRICTGMSPENKRTHPQCSLRDEP